MARISPKTGLYSISGAVMMTAVVVASTASHAGFEWKGPIAPPATGAGMHPEFQETAGFAAPLGVPVMPAVQSPPVVSAPELVVSEGDMIEGFGSDLPLVIALQQVTPPGYRQSFGAGVDPGQVVSWRGGKPWQAVLSDMLATVDMSYALDDNVILVTRFVAPPPLPAVSAAPPPVPAAAVEQPQPPVTIRREKDEMQPGFLERINIFRKRSAPAAKDMSEGGAPAQDPVQGMEHIAVESLMDEETVPAQPVTIRRERKKSASPSLLESLGWGRPAEDRPAQEDDGITTGVSAPPDGAALDLPASGGGISAADIAWVKPYASDETAPAEQAGQLQAVIAPPPAIAVPEEAPPQPVAAAMPDDDGTAGLSAAPAAAGQAPQDGVSPPVSLLEKLGLLRGQKRTRNVVIIADADVDVRTWQAQKGQSLRAALEQWSETAGVDMYWSLGQDYPLDKDYEFSGSYETAVNGILDSFSRERPRPRALMHRLETTEPGVLVVKTQDMAG